MRQHWGAPDTRSMSKNPIALCGLASVVLAAVLALAPAPVSAASVVPCTEAGIRDGLAAGQDVDIEIGCTTATTIQLSDELVVSTGRDTIIKGFGLVTLQAAPGKRVIRVDSARSVGLNGLTIRGGRSAECGGALYAKFETSVYLNDSTIIDNQAAQGGGLCLGGGGYVFPRSSAIVGNVATAPDGSGGGVYSSSALLMVADDSEISSNTAVVSGGAVFAPSLRTILRGSSFIGNRAGVSGGAFGAATVDFALAQSTMAHNSAPTGAAVASGDYSYVEVVNSTIARNSAGAGSAAIVVNTGTRGEVRIIGSLIADNTPAACGPLDAAKLRVRATVETGSSCRGGDTENSVFDAIVRLGGPARVTGTVRVLPLRAGSAGIDLFDCELVAPPVDGDGDGQAKCDAGASEFVPGDHESLPSARLLDTRSNGRTVDGQYAAGGRLGAGTTTRLRVAGRANVAASSEAAALNVTAVGAAGNGFVTAFPCTSPLPIAATLNVTPGPARSNSTVATLTSTGDMCIYTSVATDLVVDVNGATPVGSRYAPIGPSRLVDTRPEGVTVDGSGAAAGRVSAGSEVQIRVTGRVGLPDAATGIGAVGLNVVAVAPASGGFLTAYPCGTPRPLAATVNFQAGSTTANSVMATPGANGSVCVFSSADVHVVADLTGFLPGGSEFVAVRPARVLDTRADGVTIDGQSQRQGLIPAASVTRVPLAGRAGVVEQVKTVAVNVVAVGGQSNGYLTAFPCGDQAPAAATLTYPAGAGVGNAALVEIGVDQDICVFNSSPVNVVIDITGQFTRDRTPRVLPPPQ
jgi:hypothetical protein